MTIFSRPPPPLFEVYVDGGIWRGRAKSALEAAMFAVQDFQPVIDASNGCWIEVHLDGHLEMNGSLFAPRKKTATPKEAA